MRIELGHHFENPKMPGTFIIQYTLDGDKLELQYVSMGEKGAKMTDVELLDSIGKHHKKLISKLIDGQ
jgi:hypothetical protein